MTATLSPSTISATAQSTPTRPVIWRAALGYGAVASAATTTIAAVAHAAGVPVAIDGERIPLLGFAQLTFMCVLLGLALAVGIRRWSAKPQQRFVSTAVVLTALSVVPDLLVNASTDTRATLILTHLVAAAIVVPAITRRLP